MLTKLDTVRAILRNHGLANDFGQIWVFDDYNHFAFQPWLSRWQTFRRNFYVIATILKQLACWHPQWVHNGSGKQRLPLEDAYRWKGKPLSDIEIRETLPMVRHNWRCSRCRRISYRYTPDWSAEATEENNQALHEGIVRKYGPQAA